MGNNILVGLSGGPSAAINSSLAGVIFAGMKSGKFDEVYGALNGITGVLNNTIVPLSKYSDEESLRLLMQTPAMALGSCRHKLSPESFPLIEKRLSELDISAFFYIGGNDSMDTVLKLSKYFEETNNPCRVIGVPKTIDNDLPDTDHTPGYGSAAKYLYHTVSEIIRDSAIYPVESVVIIEVMGRDSGWLTLSAGLPKFLGGAAPHIVAIPETPFDEGEFINRVNALLKENRSVVCAVSEGIRDKNGEYIGMGTKSGAVDSFGHTYLSGVGKYLEGLVSHKIGCKVRSIELNVMQRCASHLAALTDLKEARLAGEAAVNAAIEGKTGVMITFKRESSSPYAITISDTPAQNVAGKAKDVPNEWFDLESKAVQKEICDYLLPLISGDLEPLKDETGLSRFLTIV